MVGISASGRAPYVLAALAHARSLGATTVSISCTPQSELSRLVEFPIEAPVGPEIVAGSTRLRAGTATKLILNMLSTATMIQLGYTYGGLMVNVQPTNTKLEDRARRIIRQLTGVSPEQAGQLLDQAGRSVPVAIVMGKKHIGRPEAERLLADARGRLAVVLKKEKLETLDRFLIQGGVPLEGTIAASGSKNSALPALAACLLTSEPVILDRVPQVRDLRTMLDLIRHIGAEVSVDEAASRPGPRTSHPEAPYDLVKTMRASSLVLGPLAARCGSRGSRSRRLRHRRAPHQSARLGSGTPGRGVRQEHGYIEACAPNGLRGARSASTASPSPARKTC